MSCSRPLLFETHLIVLPFTLPPSQVWPMPPVFVHGYHYVFDSVTVSDSKTPVTSTTLSLIWPSHIDLSLVTPFPSTTTANSIPSSYGGRVYFQLPWILLCRTPPWIHIPVLPTHFLRNFSKICACWPSLLLQLLQLHPFYSTIQDNSSFFWPFPFSLQNVMSRWGTNWRWQGFAGRYWSDLNL